MSSKFHKWPNYKETASSELNSFLSSKTEVHSKKCWVVLTQLWVKYGLTQPLGLIFTLHF